jgi:xanthine dehydrogenase accessory factor
VPRVDVFAAALRALDDGHAVALATVIGAHGSTPRHLGARMAVTSDGTQWGTVGGGRIEQLVVEAAREIAGGSAGRIVRQHLVRDLAMCCGGAMEVAVVAAERSRAALVQLTTTPGPHTVITPLDGGVMAVRPPRPGDPKPHHPIVDGDHMVEVVNAPERVVMFGLGHVGRAVGPLLAQLGFTVYACDDGETGATEPPPPWATVIESFDPAEVEREVGGFTLDDYVLIVTRDHSIDLTLLEKLIARDDIGYLGMIGSRGKIGRFRKRLAVRGLLDGDAGEARWKRLHAPIGLNIGAETPDEIAIAIAAELVACRRQVTTGA